MATAIERLALTEEQKQVLREYYDVSAKAVAVGLYFVQVPGYGVYAYNAKDVNCFDAPANAAYDNGKEEIDVRDLKYCSGLLRRDILQEPKCLVAMDEEE